MALSGRDRGRAGARSARVEREPTVKGPVVPGERRARSPGRDGPVDGDQPLVGGGDRALGDPIAASIVSDDRCLTATDRRVSGNERPHGLAVDRGARHRVGDRSDAFAGPQVRDRERRIARFRVDDRDPARPDRDRERVAGTDASQGRAGPVRPVGRPVVPGVGREERPGVDPPTDRVVSRFPRRAVPRGGTRLGRTAR
ncbi:hypothetical protein [Halorubrum sp. AS12]|uniref:hypothetical protein n=1 Tax=Halorubrum sp. AS12 TaxID=3409687 RepID=UPI003DA7716E